MRPTIDLAFGVDAPYAPYAPHLAAALRSIQALTPSPLRAFILTAEMPELERRRLAAEAPRIALHWLDFGERFAALPGFDRFRPVVFNRLALAALLPRDVQRALYLDADLVATRDLAGLFAAELNGAPLGAVIDPGVNAAAFAARFGVAPGPAYFNSGVLLLDVEQLRQSGDLDRAAAFAQRPDLEFPDQDALNRVFWGRWRALDPIWNVQKCMLIESMPRFGLDGPLRRRPGIVHFTSADKPWVGGAYVPYGELYWRALAGSSYRATVARAAGLDAPTRAKVWARWARRWALLTR